MLIRMEKVEEIGITQSRNWCKYQSLNNMKTFPVMSLVILTPGKHWVSATGSFGRSMDGALFGWDEPIQPQVMDAVCSWVPSGLCCQVWCALQGSSSWMELLAGNNAVRCPTPHCLKCAVTHQSGHLVKVSSHLSWMLFYMSLQSCVVIYSQCPPYCEILTAVSKNRNVWCFRAMARKTKKQRGWSLAWMSTLWMG